MNYRILLFFLSFFPGLVIAQAVHLEEFVVLDKYCAGEDHAVVRVLDQDGDEEFTYLWKHDSSTAQIITITSEDFGKPFCVQRFCPCGSTYESCFVFDPGKLKKGKGSIEKEDISCHGMEDGAASVYASGSGPFQYLWTNGERGSSVSNLSSGKYEVTISDALGCEEVLKTRIKEPRKLKMRPKLLAKNKTYAAVKLKISGGTPGYSLNGEKATKKLLFSTKKKKRYEFELEDARGCISTATIILKKRYKPKNARAVLTKMPKKRKKGKCKLRCPRI